MKISVIIPVYNAETYLRKAVESAVIQPEVGEIILVEDKSPDNALEICQELENRLDIVKLYQHPDKKNHGAGASRNLGIEKSTCNFIAFLDADDYYLPNRFKKDMEIFSSNNEIEGTYGVLGRYNYTTKSFDDSNPTKLSGNVPYHRLFDAIIGLDKEFHGHIHLDTLTVKRSVFDKIGFFSTHLKLHQDMNLILKLAFSCKLVCSDSINPIAIRGVHDENRVSNTTNFDFYRPYLYEDLYNWGKMNDMSKDYQDIVYRKSLHYKFNYLSTTQKIGLFILYPFKIKDFYHPLFQKLVNDIFGKGFMYYVLFGLRNRLCKENNE